MAQLHKKFSDEQIKVILRNYCSGHISRAAVEELLGIGKSRFFILLNKYRNFPDSPIITYTRNTPGRISVEHEDLIRQELNREKALVDDKRLPISSYNYSALRDRL